MHIDLGVGMNGRPGGKIGRLKGYFHALVAESFEYVDMPFKKSDKWVRLTPDVEVRARDTFCDGALHRLSTEARWQGGGSMRPLSPESHIAVRLVVGQQLVGLDNKPMGRRSGGYSLPYHVGGYSVVVSSSMGQMIPKIRYIIAVNPTHYEIPFVLDNIPLPKP